MISTVFLNKLAPIKCYRYQILISDPLRGVGRMKKKSSYAPVLDEPAHKRACPIRVF